MRVISGKAKNLKIRSPRKSTTRPISARAKEVIFSYLGYSLYSSKFLDLFCGTGSVGIEAFSRGASECVFVDSNYDAVCRLKKSITELNADSIKIFNMDVFKYLKFEQDCFDIIFAGPPYKKIYLDKLESTMDILQSILTEQGTLVIQHEKYFEFDNNLPFFSIEKVLVVGDSGFTFFKSRGLG